MKLMDFLFLALWAAVIFEGSIYTVFNYSILK